MSLQSGFAIQNIDNYKCPWCTTANQSSSASFCSCLASERTLVCSDCDRCFCEAPAGWRKAFFRSTAALAFRARNKSAHQATTRDLMIAPASVQRPVIMVVDDDRTVHLVAGRVLAEYPGTVLHAEDGERAFELAMEYQPDLVITDALLPKLDGRELAIRLKQTPETSDCKVAIITAMYKGSRYRIEAINSFQVDDYVEKPVTPARLRQIVSEQLGLESAA